MRCCATAPSGPERSRVRPSQKPNGSLGSCRPDGIAPAACRVAEAGAGSSADIDHRSREQPMSERDSATAAAEPAPPAKTFDRVFLLVVDDSPELALALRYAC